MMHCTLKKSRHIFPENTPIDVRVTLQTKHGTTYTDIQAIVEYSGRWHERDWPSGPHYGVQK